MLTSTRRSSWLTTADIYDSLHPAASTSSVPNLFRHVPSSSPPAGVQSPHPSLLKIIRRLITLPFDIVSVGVGAFLGSVQFVLSLLNLVKPLLAHVYAHLVSDPSSEAVQFVAEFKSDFGSFGTAPLFMEDKFMSALLRSQKEYKLLFVYLDSPNHPDVPYFCVECLCATPVAGYLNENFIIWGGSISSREGSEVSIDLSAYQFPFCAIIIALTDQFVFLLEEVIGPRSPEEMLKFLQEAVKKYTHMLSAARIVEKERQKTQYLRRERNEFLRARSVADHLLFASIQGIQEFTSGKYLERKFHSSFTRGRLLLFPQRCKVCRLITILFNMITAGLGLFLGSVLLGGTISSSVLYYLLSLLDRVAPQSADGSFRSDILSAAAAAEASEFVAEFTRDFGSSGTVPRFVSEGYYSCLERACKEKKPFFVYLHCPDDPEVSNFCKSSLCAAPVAEIINDHFIAWAGSISRPEGSKMSKSFEVSSFPYCAILASIKEEPVFIEQVSSISPVEMLDILQSIVIYAN